MAEIDKNAEAALEGLDSHRRETLKRLVRGGAFIAPVVASFAMQSIAIRPAHAASSNFSNNTQISDIRLKHDIVRLGNHPNGCGIYGFRYLWSDTQYVGLIAQDVQAHAPEAVLSGPAGFLMVDYAAVGVTMQAADGEAARSF
jgi:hypothetical protein